MKKENSFEEKVAPTSNAIKLEIQSIDLSLQIRPLDEDTVVDYAAALECGDEFPPVSVAFDGKNYYLTNGFHRIEAHRRNSETEIIAIVTEQSKTDARWAALGANRTNGRRLSSEDKRNAIAIALNEFQDRSANAIAEQIGCSPNTVIKYKESSCAICTTESPHSFESDVPAVSEPTPGAESDNETGTKQAVKTDRVTGKDGKSYPAKKQTKSQKRPLPVDKEHSGQDKRTVDTAGNGVSDDDHMNTVTAVRKVLEDVDGLPALFGKVFSLPNTEKQRRVDLKKLCDETYSVLSSVASRLRRDFEADYVKTEA